MATDAAVVIFALFGRLVSSIVDRPSGFYPRLFLTIEVAIAATLFAAAWSYR